MVGRNAHVRDRLPEEGVGHEDEDHCGASQQRDERVAQDAARDVAVDTGDHDGHEQADATLDHVARQRILVHEGVILQVSVDTVRGYDLVVHPVECAVDLAGYAAKRVERSTEHVVELGAGLPGHEGRDGQDEQHPVREACARRLPGTHVDTDVAGARFADSNRRVVGRLGLVGVVGLGRLAVVSGGIVGDECQVRSNRLARTCFVGDGEVSLGGLAGGGHDLGTGHHGLFPVGVGRYNGASAVLINMWLMCGQSTIRSWAGKSNKYQYRSSSIDLVCQLVKVLPE